MKKLMLAFVLSCAMVLGIVVAVSADNGPHGSFTATTDACASCHRAHSAQVGSNQLLKVDANALCMSCHNGGGAGTNVGSGVYSAGLAPGGGVEGINGTSLLGGGFNTALMASAWSGATTANPAFNATSRATTSHHVLGSGTVFGSGAANTTEDTITLECVSCHDPHGNAGYQMVPDAATGTWTIATSGTPAAPVKVPSYRLLRFQPQGSNGFTAPAASNWNGGAFPAAGTTTGWTVPDNRAALNTEWYTIGTNGAFAAGDYNANNATNAYNPSLDLAGRPNYIVDAANIAYFCAQCHDRYFTNTRLRNDTDFSLACGFDGIAANNVPAGSLYAKVGNATAVLAIRTTAASANCVEAATTIGTTATVVNFYSDAAGTALTGTVSYVSTTLWVWGDNSHSADAIHTYMHTSGDVLRASADGSFVPTNLAAMNAPTSVGRTCVACHTAHGTTANMTNLASINTLKPNNVSGVDNSVLLRMDNRSLCLRCHASTVGFTVAP